MGSDLVLRSATCTFAPSLSAIMYVCVFMQAGGRAVCD